MNTFRICAALVLVVAVVAALMPQEACAQGESAVPFLLIAPNSRASGMGETGTGAVDDVSAIYWNPAALAFLNGSEVSITHTQWLPQFHFSDMFYDHLNFRHQMESLGGTLGFSVTYLSLGEFQVTTSASPDVIARFKSFEYAVTAGYATKASEDLGLGINLRFIHSALSPIGTEKEQGDGIASTVSADIALMYRPQVLDVPLLGDIGKRFSVGMNLSNLGPKITYVDAAQADPLPTNLRLGFGMKLIQDDFNDLTYAIDFSRLLVRRRAEGKSDPFYKALFTSWGDGGLKKVIISTGMEYWYGNPHLIALRVGYFYESPQFGGRKFMTFGAGIRYDIYGFDFSYIAAAEDHPLSDTIRFSLLIGW